MQLGQHEVPPDGVVHTLHEIEVVLINQDRVVVGLDVDAPVLRTEVGKRNVRHRVLERLAGDIGQQYRLPFLRLKHFDA